MFVLLASPSKWSPLVGSCALSLQQYQIWTKANTPTTCTLVAIRRSTCKLQCLGLKLVWNGRQVEYNVIPSACWQFETALYTTFAFLVMQGPHSYCGENLTTVIQNHVYRKQGVFLWIRFDGLHILHNCTGFEIGTSFFGIFYCLWRYLSCRTRWVQNRNLQDRVPVFVRGSRENGSREGRPSTGLMSSYSRSTRTSVKSCTNFSKWIVDWRRNTCALYSLSRRRSLSAFLRALLGSGKHLHSSQWTCQRSSWLNGLRANSCTFVNSSYSAFIPSATLKIASFLWWELFRSGFLVTIFPG